MTNIKPQLAERTLPDGCLSDLTLDRWRCAELADHAAAATQLHVDTCARCRLRASSLTEQTHAVRADLPDFDTLLVAAQSRKEAGPVLDTGVGSNQRWSRRANWWTPTLALVSAAAALFFLLERRPEPSGEVRLKGGSGATEIYVKRGEEVFRWQSQGLQPGDRLRYSFRTAEPLNVVVLSRDGSNTVSQYFPTGAQSWLVSPGETLSAIATELDATIGVETLWVVFCQAPFFSDGLLDQLKHNGVVDGGQGCMTERIVFQKVKP